MTSISQEFFLPKNTQWDKYKLLCYSSRWSCSWAHIATRVLALREERLLKPREGNQVALWWCLSSFSNHFTVFFLSEIHIPTFISSDPNFSIDGIWAKVVFFSFFPVMSLDAEVRFWNYVQVKKTSTEKYVKEKFRLFLLWRLSWDCPETKRLFKFQNSQSADAFLAKWQNGDFNVPSARGTIFSRPPSLCIDLNRFSQNFFFILKRGLRKKCVQKKLDSWFWDYRATSGNNPTIEEVLTKATELEEQRKSEKRERKLVRQQLTPMQQHLIDNIRRHYGN